MRGFPLYDEESKSYTIEYLHCLGGRGYYDCPDCGGNQLRVTEHFERRYHPKTAELGLYRSLGDQRCTECSSYGTEQDWQIEDQVVLYFPRNVPERFLPEDPSGDILVAATDLLTEPVIRDHPLYGPLLRALGDSLLSLKYRYQPLPNRESVFLLLADISE